MLHATIFIYRKLVVVTCQGEHGGAVILYRAVYVFHGPAEFLVRKGAHRAEDAFTLLQGFLMGLQGDANGFAGDKEPVIGHVHATLFEHVVKRHGYLPFRQAQAQDGPVRFNPAWTGFEMFNENRQLS
ncbi:MAG: hypothetical protein BWY09_00912 [Candidatus Hydrogenedentes bacterium ADurb.Bin179]|nr:MAG: hypothetical protein BWY09_00912 [Candidatus Hydrogenedentes bacterium ADurb.Bin179]